MAITPYNQSNEKKKNKKTKTNKQKLEQLCSSCGLKHDWNYHGTTAGSTAKNEAAQA